MTIASWTLSLSHNGSTWTDVSAYVTGALKWGRGLSNPLDEWGPGTATITLTSNSRAIDPLNDAATYQPRQGDYVKILMSGSAAFYGRVNASVPSYDLTGPTVLVSMAIAAVDAVGELGAGKSWVTDTVQPFKAGTWVDAAINDPFTPWFSGTTAIDAGDVSTTSTAGGNALEVVQTLTRTEGGAVRLFATKAGVLTWKSRYAAPSQTVAFGTGGIKVSKFSAGQDQQWFNRVNVTPIEHIDSQASSSSVTNGTGTKTFTLTTPPPVGDTWGFSAGATVSISSIGSANTMSGTVTSYDETTRVLVCSITTASGSSTRTDWLLDFVEPSEQQAAYDAQSNTLYSTWKAKDLSTYHRTRPAALAEAAIRAAEMAHPRRRIEWIEVDLATCSSSEVTTILGLEIGDAAAVTLTFGAGSPDPLIEYRHIVGIHWTLQGTSQVVRFVLGRVPTYTFTAVLKQNGSTVAATTGQALYAIRDGWCDATLLLVSSGTGTANTEIKVTPTGLPTPLLTSHTAHGTFFLYGGASVPDGTCIFDGTDIHMYQDAATTPIGQSPNLALSASSVLSITMSYPVTAGQTFTATLDQAGVARSATMTGYYQKRDGWVRAAIIFTANAAGSAGNAILGTPTGLPTPSITSNECQGWGTYLVSSSGTRYPLAVRFDGTNFRCTTDNRNGLLGAAPSLAVASGDTLCVYLEYPTTA